MNKQTLKKPKQKTTNFPTILGKKLLHRTIALQSTNVGRYASSPSYGHNFSDVQVRSPSFKQSCPLAISVPAQSNFGVACQSYAPHMQAKLNIGQPGDKYEQEADRVALYVDNERPPVPTINSREKSTVQIQRQEKKKVKTAGEKYKEAVKKAGEAFLETSIGKNITDKAKKLGENFISTLPGKIVTGAAATGAVSAIVAKNAELPIPLPAIPLDKVTPGLSMKITYNGPVRNPTDASIAFSYKFGADKKGSKNPTKTKGEQFREETARMTNEQNKYRESMKTPEQKAEDESFMKFYIMKQTQDPASPLFISGMLPIKEVTNRKEKEEEEKGPLQRKEANSSKNATGSPALVDNVLRSSGQPLDPVTRDFMESRFGHDFSKVRLHTDANASKSARSLNAHAYTAGRNIVFGSDRFKSGNKSGRRLLAHELTHVIQQDSKNTVQKGF